MEMKPMAAQTTNAKLQRPDSFSRRHPMLSALLGCVRVAAFPLIVGAAVLVFSQQEALAKPKMLSPTINFASTNRIAPLTFAGPNQAVGFMKYSRADSSLTSMGLVWLAPMDGVQTGIRYSQTEKGGKTIRIRGGAAKLTKPAFGGNVVVGIGVASTTSSPDKKTSQSVDVAVSTVQPKGLPLALTAVGGQNGNVASVDVGTKTAAATVTFRDMDSGEVFAVGLERHVKYSERVGQRFYASTEMPTGKTSVGTVGTRLSVGKASVELNSEFKLPLEAQSVSVRMSISL
jgi:hypothetical protein